MSTEPSTPALFPKCAGGNSTAPQAPRPGLLIPVTCPLASSVRGLLSLADSPGRIFFFNLSPLFCLPHPHCLHPQVPHHVPFHCGRNFPSQFQRLSPLPPHLPPPAGLGFLKPPPLVSLICPKPLGPCPLFTVWSDSTCLVSQALCTPGCSLTLASDLPAAALPSSLPVSGELFPDHIWSFPAGQSPRGTGLTDSMNALPGAVSLYDQRASGLCACCFLVLEGHPLPAACENQTLLQMPLLPGSPWGSPLLERVAHVNGSLKKK